MPSEISTTIKLDPFLQRFLLSQFQQEQGDVFVFPPRHDLSMLIGKLVTPCPADYKTPQYGDWEFRITLPYMDYKNVEVYNYISQKSNIIFANHVRRLMDVVFHAELTDIIRKRNFKRKEAIDYLSDQFGFLPEDDDRLLKDYQRWLKCEQMRRYRTKRKKSKKSKENIVSSDTIIYTQ